MAERTKRGEEDRKQEDKVMTTGEAVPATSTSQTGKQPADTTRDKGTKPAEDNAGDDDAAQEG